MFKPYNITKRNPELYNWFKMVLAEEELVGDLIINKYMLLINPNKINLKRVSGSVICSGLGLITIPHWIQKLEIGGGFDCSNNKLMPLEGVPNCVIISI